MNEENDMTKNPYSRSGKITKRQNGCALQNMKYEIKSISSI